MIKKIVILFIFFNFFLTFLSAQNSSKSKLYNLRGEELYKNKNYSQAEIYFKRAITADFLNPVTRYNLAVLYKEKKDYKKSLNNIKKAISLKPFEKKYTQFLLDLYIILYKESSKLGQFEQANNFLKLSLELDENFLEAHFIIIENSMMSQNYSEAETRVDKLLERSFSRKIEMKDSDTASLLIKKAEICYYKKDYYGAYKFVVRAQKICKNLKTSDIKIINHITGPSNLLANCLFKGEEAFKKEDYQRAYEYYKKAIDLRPDLKDISLRLTNLANIRIAEEKYSTVLELFKNGKFKDCLNECGNLISLNPDSKKFLELKIKAEVAINEQNKLLQKEKELKMKEKIELQKINYIYDQAFTHFEQGNLDIAEEQLKKILKLDSANSKALELGSKISEKREIIKKEENLFAEIKNEFQSNNWNALEKLLDKNQIQERFPEIHYYRAHLFIKKGNYEEALKNIEKFILLNKLNIKAFKVKLDILYSLKYYKGIFEEIDKSDKLFKSDLEVMEIKKKAQKELKAIKNRKILAYVYKLAAFIFLIIFLKFLLLSIPGWIKNKRMKKIHSLVKKKEWSAAAKYCSVLLENYGNERSERIKLKSDLARCCMEMGNPSEAVRLCREVLSEDNKNIKVRRTLARSYLKMKTKTDEAVAEYLKLYEFEPANLSLIEVMADYYLSQGIVNKESREIIEKYLKNNRDDTKKIEIYANMLCETMASDNSALLMYEKRLEHEPADVNIREALMTALYKRKLYDRAQEHARILLNYDLKNLNFHKIYSESMINLKRAKEALDFYIDKGINNNKDMFFLIKKLEEEC